MKRSAVVMGVALLFPLIILFLATSGGGEAAVPTLQQNLQSPVTDTTWANVYGNRRGHRGILNTENQAIFGPHICVDYGDPFSSYGDPQAALFREQWLGDEDERTYTYRILIPGDYPDDVVRVELFDPDSVNRPNNTAGGVELTVTHTVKAVDQGMPATELLACASPQTSPCLVHTGEADLGLGLDAINPWYFARIDENRGAGPPPGNPTMCGAPVSYDEAYNTVTYYELYYYQELPGGATERTQLATYWGQSGDDVESRSGWPRDRAYSSYDHQTDLRWVSPGGAAAADQPVAVPAGCGSPNGGDYDPVTCPEGTPPAAGRGFEIELDDDLPNIVTDPESGERTLYLAVRSESGASENGYDLWAGPNDYVATVPGDVNARNVHLLDNPDGHDPAGAAVFGRGLNLINSNTGRRVEVPLTYLGPEYAGRSLYVSLYDADAGTQPPVTFSVDTLAETDWSLTFSAGDPDPDGVSGRCVLGNCGTQWIDPPYRIDLPTYSEACTDPSDPAQRDVCTPFFGGRLMAHYESGVHDTYLRYVLVPDDVGSDPVAGCAAFPLVGDVGARSLSQAGYDALTFTYPSTKPAYDTFVDHEPDAPLLSGEEGYLYRYEVGAGPQQLGLLQWNSNITGLAGGGSILAESLTWPGNSRDYLERGDAGMTTPVFRGYAEAGDYDGDRALHEGDWVLQSAEPFADAQLPLQDHVDSGRALRLPLWDDAAGGYQPNYDGSGNGRFRVDAFGIFDVVAYGDDWVLLQLVRLDGGCRETVAVDAVSLQGPASGLVGDVQTFTATVAPLTATLPIEYSWRATGQQPFTHTGGLSHTAAFTWTAGGPQVITVTATNGAAVVTATHDTMLYTPPAAAFTAAPLTGTAPLTVTFANHSSGDFTACHWTFGDGAEIHGCAGPTHTYTTPGTYTATLTVAGPGGSDALTRTGYVHLYQPATAAFTAAPLTGTVPLTVTFANHSAGDFTACHWTFGDGAESYGCAGPTHTYTMPGAYTATLTVAGPGGSDTLTKSAYIDVYIDGNGQGHLLFAPLVLDRP